MAFTREQWATDFLHDLGNPNPSPATVDWVVGWTTAETATDSGATFNLLNTTQRASGSTSFNSVGVQNYPNYAEGVQENATVLGQNFAGYAALKQALVNNDVSSLEGPSSGVQQGLRTWCGGCGYGSSFETLGMNHLNDSFSYGSAGGGGSSRDIVINPNGTTSSTTTPCPSNIANIPVIGGVYCTGWNLQQGVSSGNLIAPLLQNIFLFVLGLVMFAIGFYLLAHQAQNETLNVVLPGSKTVKGRAHNVEKALAAKQGAAA